MSKACMILLKKTIQETCDRWTIRKEILKKREGLIDAPHRTPLGPRASDVQLLGYLICREFR